MNWPGKYYALFVQTILDNETQKTQKTQFIKKK